MNRTKRTKAEMTEGLSPTEKATARMLQGNTMQYTRDKDGAQIIVLHETEIIAKFKSGKIQVFTGGWKTPTTKSRIQEHTPVRITQIKGEWYINGNKDIPFIEGMMFTEDGHPIGHSKSTAKAKKRMERNKKLIDRYMKKLDKMIEKNKIPEPTAGDCWYCAMHEEKTGKPLGDLSHSNHIEGHLEEQYIMGSLILNAMKEKGYGDYLIYSCFKEPAKWKGHIKRVVKSYLKKHLDIEQSRRGDGKYVVQ
jgi:hypothetical protein